jgi:hypothetical protein
MIHGAHVLLYSADPEADRAFFRDVLKFPSVDVGRGWLIFALPPAEAAVHPGDSSHDQSHADHRLLGAVLYLMCDDLDATLRDLSAKKVAHTEIATERWGRKTTIKLPSGGELGLYQPTHPTALNLR